MDNNKLTPDGYYISDRCDFCSDFGVKARPYVCEECWFAMQKLMLSEGWTAPDSPSGDQPDPNNPLPQSAANSGILRQNAVVSVD